MLHPYPDNPASAVQLLVDSLRGNTVEPVELAHAAWHLVGYGLRHVDPHPVPDLTPKNQSVCPVTPDDNASKADLLEKCFLVKSVGAEAIPWALILTIAMELLSRWLNR